MKLDAVIRWFMPKEERFHQSFSQDTSNLVHAAKVFASIARSTDLATREVLLVELKGLEHKGDEITQGIFEALNTTFITPMDREDIRSLANDLDDVLDYFESVARLLTLFELSESPEPLRQFGSILEAMSQEIHNTIGLVWDLSNAKAIHAGLVRISELENQADALYQTVIAHLFKSPAEGPARDPLEVLKWKEVYDGLENACDACKDTAHVLGNIVTKGA